jgi:hypothetical protein
MPEEVQKSPEQLQIGDVIPEWGVDRLVKHVEFVTENKKVYARVTFADEQYAVYSPGTLIRVLQSEES